jgi:hypothetical protein
MAIDTSSVTLCNQLDCEDGRGLGREGPVRRLFLPPILGVSVIALRVQSWVPDGGFGCSGWGGAGGERCGENSPGPQVGPHVWSPVHPSPCVLPCRS